MPLSDKERQQRRRNKLKKESLAEVRGIHVSPELHENIKQYAERKQSALNKSKK